MRDVKINFDKVTFSFDSNTLIVKYSFLGNEMFIDEVPFANGDVYTQHADGVLSLKLTT